MYKEKHTKESDKKNDPLNKNAHAKQINHMTLKIMKIFWSQDNYFEFSTSVEKPTQNIKIKTKNVKKNRNLH